MLRRWLGVAAILAACGGGGGSPDPDAAPDAVPEPPPGEQVFATDRLHRVDLEVAEMHMQQLADDRENRVPCTVTFDGIRIENAGVRQKGGYGSTSNLDEKPAFSLKLNEFVSGQRLDGMKKLWLNNAKEDATLLSEHIGFETYRRMGLPASRTAHAIVTLNGFVYGLYVLVEPVGDDLFDREFGAANDQGNLYEGFYHPEDQSLGDFVTHPEALDLKDEVEEMRSRDDVIALAAAIRDASDAAFETEVAARLDLDRYLTALAIDTFVGYWDSYAYFLNNYYLYHHPTLDRFVYLPHGMDQLRYSNPGAPMGVLPQRIDQIPALAARLQGETDRVRAAWDVAALHARIDQVAAILATAPSDPRIDEDRGEFDANVDAVKAAIAALP